MGPICILVMMRRKNWSQSVIMFISPIRMNGLKTASCLIKGRGRGKNPCDTDTGNERSVSGLAFYYLSLLIGTLMADIQKAVFQIKSCEILRFRLAVSNM